MYGKHYHVVFPMKYREMQLDGEVTKIITETARGSKSDKILRWSDQDATENIAICCAQPMRKEHQSSW